MLSDSHIRLRALETSDILCLYDWENLSDMWLSSATLAPYSSRNLMQYISDYNADPYSTGQLRLMIETLPDHVPSGLIDLYNVEVRHRRACIGILIAPQMHRQGIALRALRLIENYCRSHLRLHQLIAAIPDVNIASLKLFEKAGFIKIATMPHYIGGTNESEYIDAIVMNKILQSQPK